MECARQKNVVLNLIERGFWKKIKPRKRNSGGGGGGGEERGFHARSMSQTKAGGEEGK